VLPLIDRKRIGGNFDTVAFDSVEKEKEFFQGEDPLLLGLVYSEHPLLSSMEICSDHKLIE